MSNDVTEQYNQNDVIVTTPNNTTTAGVRKRVFFQSNRKKRPPVVINQYPKNLSSKYITKKTIVPGEKFYSETVIKTNSTQNIF